MKIVIEISFKDMQGSNVVSINEYLINIDKHINLYKTPNICEKSKPTRIINKEPTVSQQGLSKPTHCAKIRRFKTMRKFHIDLLMKVTM